MSALASQARSCICGWKRKQITIQVKRLLDIEAQRKSRTKDGQQGRPLSGASLVLYFPFFLRFPLFKS